MRKKRHQELHPSIITPQALPFASLQGHHTLFFLPYIRPFFSPQSFPFCQPSLCCHKSPDKMETQRFRRQHQLTATAPEHSACQPQCSIPEPSSTGCASLLLSSKSHTSWHRNTLGLYYCCPPPEGLGLRPRVWDLVKSFQQGYISPFSLQLNRLLMCITLQ